MPRGQSQTEGLAGDTRTCAPAPGSEAALLLAIAHNLAERAELYVVGYEGSRLSALASELHNFAQGLGPDPLGIGEGVRRG